MIEGEELKGWSGEGRKNAAIAADLCRAATAKELSNTDPKFPRLGTAEITRNCSFELKPPPPPFLTDRYSLPGCKLGRSFLGQKHTRNGIAFIRTKRGGGRGGRGSRGRARVNIGTLVVAIRSNWMDLARIDPSNEISQQAFLSLFIFSSFASFTKHFGHHAA